MDGKIVIQWILFLVLLLALLAVSVMMVKADDGGWTPIEIVTEDESGGGCPGRAEDDGLGLTMVGLLLVHFKKGRSEAIRAGVKAEFDRIKHVPPANPSVQNVSCEEGEGNDTERKSTRGSP